MTFGKYLADHILYIGLNLLFLVITFYLLYFFNVNYVCMTLIIGLFIFNFIFILVYRYIKKVYFYKRFEKILNSLDREYLITDMITEPDFLDGKLLYNYLYTIDKSMNENVNKYKRNNKDFREYIELWCHEIKTPVAAAKLLVDNNKNEVTNSVGEEIKRIDKYIEQVLFYSRSNNVEKDYIIKKCDLNQIIDTVIKNNKKELIGRKIKIDIDVSDNVYTDSKWIEFIINQIISNSIKYDSSIIKIKTIKNVNNVFLSIEDDGIGISSNEIDKVFNKGFTGSNGRKKYNSTGLGLYLTKKLCLKLGINVQIKSEEKKGTTLTLVFPIDSTLDVINK